MAHAAVKTEVKEEESPVHLPGAMDEDEIYEDAGDLEFYDPTNKHKEQLYLTRLPKYVWEAWLKLIEGLNDDDEVQIGTMRTWNVEDASTGQKTSNLRMLLASHAEHQAIPHEYRVTVQDSAVQNHFVFSEADFPGFEGRNNARTGANAGMPASMLKPKTEPSERKPFDRKRRYEPYYRKAIPKKTKIFGKIHYDLRVEPVDKREETELMNKRIFEVENSKQKVEVISSMEAQDRLSHTGTDRNRDWANNFVPQAPTKAKKSDGNKAARVAKNELLDMLFKCFREFQYWPMKALRKQTGQPDSYLRQVLEEIAVLNKAGSFANTYCLNSAYADQGGNAKAEVAADVAAEDEDEDDDEGEEMEDVLPA